MARKGYKTKTIMLPDGSRKYIYAKTQKELDQKVLEAQLQLRAGVDLRNHDTFGEYAQLWWNTYKKPNISPTTAGTALSLINTNIMPVLSGYRMSKITPMLCQTVFSNMTEKGTKESTQKKVLTLMKAIFNSAVDNGVISKSPITKTSVKVGGEPSEKRKALTPDQVAEFTRNIRSYKGGYYSELVTVALGTGMRIGELLGLQWDCVDMEACEVEVKRNMIINARTVLNDHTKTEAGMRTIPFGNDVLTAFKKLWLRRNGDFVFHKQYSDEPLWYSTVRLAMVECSPSGVLCTPHILRHTYITNLFDAGFDLKECQMLAGHRDARMTANVYIDYLNEKRFAETKAKIQSAQCTTQRTTQCTTSVPQQQLQM